LATRTRTTYRCTECGAEHPKWQGRCDACGEWNTLVEEIVAKAARPVAARPHSSGGAPAITKIGDVRSARTARVPSGIDELDFVLGGGVVPGSMILVGGEPGIGKSTLLLQVAGALAGAGRRVLYVSGEESALQIKLRAERLHAGDEVSLLCATSLEEILAAATEAKPDAVIVDSIQTVATEELEGAPGNVGQVRECAARLMRYAKSSGAAVMVVGHVTKGGGIAGPKTLEHVVDAVLQFEGEGVRIIASSVPPRTASIGRRDRRLPHDGGRTDRVGNPSALFLGDRGQRASGSATAALIEGTRPILVEVQALAAKAGFGTPQRVSTGFDARRLALLLAVLDKRTGLSFAALDVFVNGSWIAHAEPQATLSVAVALASSVHDRALGADMVFLGEVGLGGELRPVTQTERRLAEAAQLGFRTAWIPARSSGNRTPSGLDVVGVESLQELFGRLFR
jgi:DNA repair protein RadA/Sms